MRLIPKAPPLAAAAPAPPFAALAAAIPPPATSAPAFLVSATCRSSSMAEVDEMNRTQQQRNTSVKLFRIFVEERLGGS